jgi:serine/threonine-protein kinase
MSPEQAEGKLEHLGPCSDVYSLGATLYFLLTGKAPFDGEVAEVLRQVQRGQFPPPRQVDATIDQALEAVCLKAMALRQADRYATPRALAEDLERWAADEPVSAYPEPWRRRLARWERRHKTLVYSGVSVLVLTVVALAVTGVVISREQQVTRAAREQAEQNAVTAQAHLSRAIDAVYQSLSQVADSRFNRVPRMEPVRKELNDRAIASFQDFLKLRPDDPSVLRMADRVYRNAANVRWVMGDFPGAESAYGEAIKICEKLHERIPADLLNTPLMVATAYRDMAAFLQENGHDQEAAPYFEKARGLTDELLAGRGGSPEKNPKEVRRMTGWLAVRLGEARLEHGDLDGARRSFERAIDLLAPVAGDPNEWYWYRIFVGLAHRGLGLIAPEQGQPAVSEREFAEALRIHRDVFKESQDPDPRQQLAVTLVRHGEGLMADPGRAQQADHAFDEAVALLDGVVDEFPAVTWYRRDRAGALLARGARLAATNRVDQAERDLNEARRILEELAAKEPENRSYPGDLGRVALALGRLRLRQGRAADARTQFAQAVRHLERASQARPDHVLDRRSLDEARTALRPAAGATGPSGRILSNPEDRLGAR